METLKDIIKTFIIFPFFIVPLGIGSIGILLSPFYAPFLIFLDSNNSGIITAFCLIFGSPLAYLFYFKTNLGKRIISRVLSFFEGMGLC